MTDGSLLARATRRPSTRVKLTVQDRPARDITAFASSCSTTRTCRWAVRAARSKAPCALTEFEVEAAPADAPDKIDEGQDRQGDGRRRTRRRRRSEPIFDDKSGKTRVTGPVEFAIDGKDETAWGIDAGPGRRNQPRKAVFALEKPVVDSRRARS